MDTLYSILSTFYGLAWHARSIVFVVFLRLSFLFIFSLSLFFSQLFFLGSKIIFSEPSQTALARRILGFSKKKIVLAQKRKKDNMLKCLAAWQFSNYTPIFAKFSVNVPSSWLQPMSCFGAKNPQHLLMAASSKKILKFLVFPCT